MNNKKFLIVAIVAGILGFGALIVFGNKKEAANAIPKVSSDILIKFHSPTKGNANAPVTIVEFLDPECEACRAMHPIIKELLSEYGEKVRLVIRYLPLHKNSLHAAAAIEEAREQGKFEEALDTLFHNQPIWGDHHSPKPELIAVYLADIGIPKDTLNPEALIAKHGEKIEIDRKDAELVGARQTPTFFVNGVKLDKIGYQAIKDAIEKAL